MENCPVGAEFFHADWLADRQTDRHDEANSRFLQFYVRPQKRLCYGAGH